MVEQALVGTRIYLAFFAPCQIAVVQITETWYDAFTRDFGLLFEGP